MGETMSAQTPDTPAEIRDGMCLLALLAGPANVVMQLSRLPVGHAVAKSTVDSGRVDKHPLKRTRTTCAFLALAALGTDEERLLMRGEIGRAHRGVRSRPGEDPAYDAFDPDLQLWVAACLYKGFEDVYSAIYGPPPEPRRDLIYRYAWRLGSTLQVGDERWPPDRRAFEEYWREGVARAEMDELTRPYLQSIADFTFLVAPLGPASGILKPVIRRIGWTITGGFLPEPFREQLGLGWSAARQRQFETFVAIAAGITRALPGPLREFPFNVYLWDTRRRFRRRRAVV